MEAGLAQRVKPGKEQSSFSDSPSLTTFINTVISEHMTKLKLLLVEDNDTDALLVVRHLKKEGFEVDHLQVKTKAEMEAGLAQDGWDIVISDYSLPGFGGDEALELFKSKKPDIPFILVSGTVGEDIAVNIMKGGANDYLMKTHLYRLGPAVKRELAETVMKREKKRIESVLSQTEKRFQRLIHDLLDVVWLSNMDGSKLYIVNAAFEKIFGLSTGDINASPKHWIDQVLDEDKSLFEKFLQNLPSREIDACEYRIRKPDGAIRWVYDQRYLVRGEGNEEEMVGGILSDITDDKRNETELIHAKQAAEESSRLKSAMLQNMSHEFRTPMNGILGFSEMLHNELSGQDLQDMAGHILTSGMRLQNTLDSIMLYAQLEGGLTLNLTNVNVTKLVNKTAEMFRESVILKGLNLDVQADEQLFFISDENLLQKSLIKIMENAVKFTSTGGITLKAKYAGEKNDRIQIVIKDTGIGIAREKQKMIFEEFRQADEGYNRPYEGSGLGLSIARKSTELLRGSIAIESEPGKGTAFVLTLPSHGSQQKMLLSPDETETTSAVIPDKKTITELPLIILVEDNEANIELVGMYLKMNFRLDVATTGERSLEMVKKSRYQAILMDINLGPGMDGIDAITEIRKMPEYLNTPIIAVTGYTFQNEKEYIISKGADYYLEKPFRKQVLIDLLQGILS
jgi:PAS domain S-box-containing protein